MSVCTLIYDHLAVVLTEFCLRLRCWTLSKVVKKLVAVSPGSVIAIWNNSYFFYGWNIELITSGQSHSDKSDGGIAARNDIAYSRNSAFHVVGAVTTPEKRSL